MKIVIAIDIPDDLAGAAGALLNEAAELLGPSEFPGAVKVFPTGGTLFEVAQRDGTTTPPLTGDQILILVEYLTRSEHDQLLAGGLPPGPSAERVAQEEADQPPEQCSRCGRRMLPMRRGLEPIEPPVCEDCAEEMDPLAAIPPGDADWLDDQRNGWEN